jgi:two-component system sensor histidine kinase TctE
MRTEPRLVSLQRRLLLAMAGGFALLLLIISVLLWSYARTAANRINDLPLAGAALAMLERASIGPEGPTIDLPNSAMDILALNTRDRVQYRVFSPTMGEITGTGDLPLPDGMDLSDVPRFYDATYLGAPFRFVIQGRRMNTPSGRDWIVVQVGQTVETRRHDQMSFYLSGMTGLAALSVIGLVCVWIAIRTALAPLRQIAGELRRRDPADLADIPGSPPREIRGLFTAINGFIARLRQNRALTETFIADVAHQTRTSLSALQGHLALAADATDYPEMKARVDKAGRQAARTVRLSNQLLANAMVIHRSDRASLQPLSLCPLVRDTLADLLRDSRMRRIALSFEDEALAPEGDRIRGDALSIREALNNLVENAARHGPADNSILVALENTPGRVVLRVEDAGPGIAEADLARATERFTSLAAATRGSGLGLSIVQAVAEGHDAVLRLSRSRLGGLCAELSFPRLAALMAVLLCWGAGEVPAARAEALSLFSATDAAAMEPLIAAFEARNPGIEVVFTEFHTVDLYKRLRAAAPGTMPDVVISSAMDLQVDLVNRGLARRLALPATHRPPDWAQWRGELFGFTFEPAAVIYDTRFLGAHDLPSNHRDLAQFIRDNEARLTGRIGSYDLRSSGIGYLYATQDSLQGPQAQRLIEVLGRARVRTYCCTADMFAATARGELALAHNVIGSYAATLARGAPHVGLHFFDDYNLVMTRTAFVPRDARAPDLGARFVEFLLSPAGQEVIAAHTPLIPLAPERHPDLPIARRIAERPGAFLAIRLSPSLLTYLDRLKQRDFLRAWDASVLR